ncbi:MAG: hypothetical protein V4565_12595 [Bacteroidota bacterium]
MKKVLYLIIIIIYLITLTATAQRKQDSFDILKITGAALLNDQRIANYAVSVYLDGTKIDSIYARSKKTIKFYISYNKVYTVLFQKKNCLDKIVIVNTHIPEGLKSMEDNTFDFEVEMSQSLSKKSANMEDYPIAVLLIDKNEEILHASDEYNRLTHNVQEILSSSKSEKINSERDKK